MAAFDIIGSYKFDANRLLVPLLPIEDPPNIINYVYFYIFEYSLFQYWMVFVYRLLHPLVIKLIIIIKKTNYVVYNGF